MLTQIEGEAAFKEDQCNGQGYRRQKEVAEKCLRIKPGAGDPSKLNEKCRTRPKQQPRAQQHKNRRQMQPPGDPLDPDAQNQHAGKLKDNVFRHESTAL